MPFGKLLLWQGFTSAVEEGCEQSCVISFIYSMSLLALAICDGDADITLTTFIKSYVIFNMWTVHRIQSLQTDCMSSAYFCSYYVAVCPYQFSASSKEVFLIAYKGTIFFSITVYFLWKKWFLGYSCWFLFSWLLVLFCRTTSLILLINRLMGQIYLKETPLTW